MNVSALKSFAPAVRRQLMEAVSRKLDIALAAERPDYRTTYAGQVESLRKLAKQDRDGLIERAAYTWFNRLTALRYLDARGWHPFKARVLTPSSQEETQPELLRLARGGTLPEELRRHVNAERIAAFLDGSLTSTDAQGEAYRDLILGACRFYHTLLPDLFERLDDETELLLPDDLLTEQSIAHGFRTEITDEDCAEVEVLGWLYQFYISEKKDEVMGRKSAVPREDIPAVTQLFTPHWIVRYLVENSLGRLWLLNRPDSRLRELMPYYVDAGAETDFPKITRPEDIRLIDPAVGSGHVLTYAFDVLQAIYEEEGYPPSEIPGLILKHNLYGVDIDSRAAQLASLALVLKAREKARRFLQADDVVRPNVIALQDVRFDERELREYILALDLGDLFNQSIVDFLHKFEKATTFGSLINPDLSEQNIQLLQRQMQVNALGGELFLTGTHQKVLRVLEQAEYLTQRYHVAATNPPYMGRAGMSGDLRAFVDAKFPEARHNLFSAFMDRLASVVMRGAWLSMVTMQNWMFLSRFVSFRQRIIDEWQLDSLLHLGSRAFDSISGEVVQTAAFTFRVTPGADRASQFIRLVNGVDSDDKARLCRDAITGVRSELRFDLPIEAFTPIADEPFCYWATTRELELFKDRPPLRDRLVAREGMATGSNDVFLRLWHEVPKSKACYDCDSESATDSGKRWFPYNKGGGDLRWYGNNEYVVNWERDGEAIRAFRDEVTGRTRSHNYNGEYAFREGITWSSIGSGRLAVRKSSRGSLFDAKGTTAFAERGLMQFMGLLNSAVGARFISLLSPTLDFKLGHVLGIPFVEDTNAARVHDVVSEAVALAKRWWDSNEISRDFSQLPLLLPDLKAATLAESWERWAAGADDAINRMAELETENNRLWIDAYGLGDELSSSASRDEITLAPAERGHDMVAFVSYAVGCMMGRYSIDTTGLILADSNDTTARYLTIVGKGLQDLLFVPDADGIIPVLEDEWFEDDVVGRTREFLRATFGEATLRENLRYLEESLGKDVRKYFVTDFYKDHLQTYKKRPIYWMVQSPKKGFSALIYLHRYNKDTLNVVLNRYLREYLVKLRTRIAHLERVQAAPGAAAREVNAARKETDKLSKVLHECEDWERNVLLPKAQARIELDLDDGVKVNYLKLADVLAPIPGLAKAED